MNVALFCGLWRTISSSANTETVAQIDNLLYRRLAVGRTFTRYAPSTNRAAVEQRRHAGCQPAKQQTASLRYSFRRSLRQNQIRINLLCHLRLHGPPANATPRQTRSSPRYRCRVLGTAVKSFNRRAITRLRHPRPQFPITTDASAQRNQFHLAVRAPRATFSSPGLPPTAR